MHGGSTLSSSPSACLQVWEETAAKHVSLAAQLQQVAALASRWRQLELASWKGLLHRTVERFAQGADKVRRDVWH